MKTPMYNKSGNMVVESGWKTFDHQTNLIARGNVIANTQYSNYIRPYSEIHNFGYTAKPGEFVKYDLQCFHSHIPEQIRDILFDKNRKDGLYLYQFSVKYPGAHGYRAPFAFLLTDKLGRCVADEIICAPGQSYQKRFLALELCKEYICED